jgi:hypothetical protein
MLLNEFSQNHFTPTDDRQWNLLEEIKEYRSKFGITKQIQILRSLAKTRPFTRTVYPQNWKAE